MKSIFSRFVLIKQAKFIDKIKIHNSFFCFSTLFVNPYSLQSQNKIIEEQKLFVEKANQLLPEKNQEITDSITYAKRIQNALITNENYIENHLKRLMKK